MSHMTAAVRGVCNALDCCFTGYTDRRRVSSSVRHPMDGVAIVDFSIRAEGFEVCGSLVVVVNVVDWSGVCFISDISPASKRWLRHGPIKIEASEVVWELASKCSGNDHFDLIVPPVGSTTYGFRFDLAVA